MQREIIRIEGAEGGPLVVICAGIHGNEIAGIKALKNLHHELLIGGFQFQGTLIGILGNIEAIKHGKRFIKHDLNRIWKRKFIQEIINKKEPLQYEEVELIEIHSLLNHELKKRKYSEAIFMDLHTTSAENGAFNIIPDSMIKHYLPTELQVPVIVGLAEDLNGTALEYWSEYGFTGFAFEAGDHTSENSIKILEAACWVTLVSTKFIREELNHNIISSHLLLRMVCKDLPHFIKLMYHHRIQPGDNFVMVPGYQNFSPVKKGELLAHDKNGPVFASMTGMLLMPLYQKEGNDGFFLVREVSY